MKRNNRNMVILIASVAILGLSAYAFADWGDGYGMMGGRGGRGMGMGYHMGWGDGGYSYRGSLSEQEYQNLEEQQQKFFTETETLRRKTYEKEMALQSEMAKETPDAKRAAELQKELSDLNSEFNQKRIDHLLTLRKTNPDLGKGFMGGGPMMGYGPGGMMMGYGPGGCY